MKMRLMPLLLLANYLFAVVAGLENKGKDCWKNCNRKQGPCDWCGSMGFCCTKKNGWTDTSNGCDGSFGGEKGHECALKPSSTTETSETETTSDNDAENSYTEMSCKVYEPEPGTSSSKVVTTSGTTIVSPDFGGWNYPAFSDCELTITFEEKQRVLIQFESFDLQNVDFLDKTCNDYLAVYDGRGADKKQIGSRLCGMKLPGPIQSTGNSMTLVFRSDRGWHDHGGFKLKAYGIVDGGWREDDFTKCTEKCSGTQTFNKYCDNPKPLHQGKDCLCTGGSEEISCNGSFAIIQKLCHDEACPAMCQSKDKCCVNVLHTKHNKDGDTGKYFFFSNKEFSQMVGNEDWDEKEFEIFQDGSHSWTGKVIVWNRGSGSYGRKLDGYADGDWGKGDRITLQGCTEPDLPFCEPYLLSACEIAAEKLGRPIEKGNWTTKGCYYYKEGTYTDKVYFSTNGTLDENKIYPSFDHWPSPWRPNGFDCKSDCKKDSDCNQLYPTCKEGTCIGPTCNDGIQNQNEADIDCGGPCPACSVCRTANFGTNWYQNSKTIKFPGKFKCPKNVDKSNWIGENGHGDKFSITQTDTSITVRRTDSGKTNWGMELKFWCCKECVPTDDDVCLTKSPGWASNSDCAYAKDYCNSWAKDARRCCPQTCESGLLTKAQCENLDSKGTCIYPTKSQCPNEEHPCTKVKIDHTNHYKAGDTGKYFIFSKDEFSKMVGHENWNAKEIHITQEGSHMWSGKVTVWVGTSKYESHGRKSEGAANGDWEKDDSIKLAGCEAPPSFTYQCSKGFCGPTYGSAVEGSSENVGRACSNDQPKCEAYQYSKTSGYGHLCSSEKNDGYHRDAQNCIKTEAYCTGNFKEKRLSDAANGLQRPDAGTRCVSSCIYSSGRWGSSSCYTDSEKEQWGAECVPCSEICTYESDCSNVQYCKKNEGAEHGVCEDKCYEWNEQKWLGNRPTNPVRTECGLSTCIHCTRS